MKEKIAHWLETPGFKRFVAKLNEKLKNFWAWVDEKWYDNKPDNNPK